MQIALKKHRFSETGGIHIWTGEIISVAHGLHCNGVVIHIDVFLFSIS